MSGYVDNFTTQTEVASNSLLNLTLVDATPYQFYWPSQSRGQAEILPGYLRIVSSVASSSIVLPDGTKGSVGYGFRVANLSTNNVSVYLANMTLIITLIPGQNYIVTLTDDTTYPGAWDYTIIGTVVSSYDAYGLSGYGLTAVSNQINSAHIIVDFSVDKTIGASDRATVMRWTGGAGVLTLVDMSYSGDGFYALVRNDGTGNLSITPDVGVTLDGSGSSLSLSPSESILINNNTTEWSTLYYNAAASNLFDALSIACSASGTQVLTSTELAAELQDMTGVLTGDLDIEYASAVGLWFITNNTTGAFDLTVKATNIDTGVIIPAGSSYVVKSDGVTMSMATPSAGTVTSVTTSGGLTGGPITTTGDVSIEDVATLTPGTYGGTKTSAQVTFNAKGQATVAVSKTISVLPLASIIAYGGAADPAGDYVGWLLCDGRAINRVTYADLFSLVGTTFGVGDGVNTFNIPDLRGRIPVGADNMGGVSASRVTLAGSGIDGTIVGSVGGNQLTQVHGHGTTDAGHVHGITDAGHVHGTTDPGHVHGNGVGGTFLMGAAGVFAISPGSNATAQPNTASATTSITINSATTGVTINSATTGITINNYGSGSSQNMPPTLVTNWIIRAT